MKKLIIVCEENLKTYADFLSQLMSLKDDKGDKVIGIKDGSAAAQVWTEKEYTDNASQISSEQYILFMGNSKIFKDKRKFMPIKYSEYGMKYGWLGKQGAIFVENIISGKKYEQFIKYANTYQPQNKKLEAKYKAYQLKYIDNNQPSSKKKASDPLGMLMEVTTGIQKGSLKVINNAVKNINKAANDLNKTVNGKQIEDQQYSCLTLIFYLQGLSDFLEISEE